jgi:enoyl-CoA hydratase/carnithine racemase
MNASASLVTPSGRVLSEAEDSMVTITVDSGPKNLLNPFVMTQLRDALESADRDPSVAGMVLTGAGGVFCGGLDVSAIQAGADPREFARELVALLGVFPKLTKPVAAAVNGDALASGASLVASCDFAAAAAGTRLGTYEVSVGIWPMIAQVPLIHRLGARAAMENIGAGEPFTAQRALDVGLIQRVVDPDAVLSTVREWLTAAARAGAAGTCRPSVYELAEMPYPEALSVALGKFVAQFEDPS